MIRQIALTIFLTTGFMFLACAKSFGTTAFYLFPEDTQQRIYCDSVEIKNNQIICTDDRLIITYELSHIDNMVIENDGKSSNIQNFSPEIITRINNINELHSDKEAKQRKTFFGKLDVAQQLSFDSFTDFAITFKNKFQFSDSVAGIVLLISGSVMVLIGSLAYLIATFRVGILWGLSCLFLPFVSLIFLFVHWKVAARPFFISMFGVALLFSGALFAPAVKQSSDITKSQPVNLGKKAPVNPRYTCSGKIYCSEMTSCAEATFYLRNCPGTKMDGDNDGVPCENQWCR